MIHSKQLTTLVIVLLTLLIVGSVYYMYLSGLIESEEEVPAQTSVPAPEPTEEDVLQALELRLQSAASSTLTEEQASTSSDRLEAASMDPSPLDEAAIRARLDSAGQ